MGIDLYIWEERVYKEEESRLKEAYDSLNSLDVPTVIMG